MSKVAPGTSVVNPPLAKILAGPTPAPAPPGWKSPFTPVSCAPADYTSKVRPFALESVRKLLDGEGRPPYSHLKEDETIVSLSWRTFNPVLKMVIASLRDCTSDAEYVNVGKKPRHNRTLPAVCGFLLRLGTPWFFRDELPKAITWNKLIFSEECGPGGRVEVGSPKAMHYSGLMKPLPFEITLGTAPGKPLVIPIWPGLNSVIGQAATNLEIDKVTIATLAMVRALAFQPDGVIQDQIRDKMREVWASFEEHLKLTREDTATVLDRLKITISSGSSKETGLHKEWSEELWCDESEDGVSEDEEW